MASRARRSRAEEPASRSQMPPPKSAPANRAQAAMAATSAMPTVMASPEGVPAAVIAAP